MPDSEALVESLVVLVPLSAAVAVAAAGDVTGRRGQSITIIATEPPLLLTLSIAAVVEVADAAGGATANPTSGPLQWDRQ
jgi:hypothetical protein